MIRRTALLILLCSTLPACGGGSGSGGGGGGGGADTTAPTATTSPAETQLGIRAALTITFSEAMNPASLELSGDLAGAATQPAWSAGNTVLTLMPAAGHWESGIRTLTVNANDVAGNALAELAVEKHVRLVFEDFQAADVVIGQAGPEGNAANQGGGLPGATTLASPHGKAAIAGGRFYLPDSGNSRVLGFNAIPTVDNAAADFVLGQNDFSSSTPGTTLGKFDFPRSIATDGEALVVADYSNGRMLVFETAPSQGPANASHAVGPDGNCAATGVGVVSDVAVAGDRLVAASTLHHRVLVWNSATPAHGTPAALVLGQPDLETCVENSNADGNSAGPGARSLKHPVAVWTDGTRLAVADYGNHRVLIWNAFPTEDFEAADVVIGQDNFTRGVENDANQDGTPGPVSARTLYRPHALASNGVQLFVADYDNHRVLIWNAFPTENFTPADIVLGQDDFVSALPNDTDRDGVADGGPSASTLFRPTGLALHGDRLIVTDTMNNRYLIFTSN